MTEKLITVTVPSSTEEMTLRQLEQLLRGDLLAVLGIGEEALDADLDDLQGAIDALSRARIVRAPFTGELEIDSVRYAAVRNHAMMSVAEFEAAERAREAGDIALLCAIYVRPRVTRLDALRNAGLSWELVRGGWDLDRVEPYSEEGARARAELFRDRLTGSAALGIWHFYGAPWDSPRQGAYSVDG